MDNFEYLRQISASTRPASQAQQKSKIFSGSIAKIAIGGIVIFFLLMAIGGLIGGLGNKSGNLAKQLYLRSTNLNTVITANNKLIKSSQLRAIGLSLSTVLTNSTRELSAYLAADGSKDALVPDSTTLETESKALEELQTSLNNARLNGILDRIYSNEIGLQVSLIMSLITELDARTDNPQLKTVLENYYTNLSPIHNSFQNYSDAAS